MSNEQLPSLLDRAPPLPGLSLDDLTPDERAQGEGRAEHPCGEFSAVRFHALYPERYATIARALAEGFSLEAAARVFRIHERTAAAIREREARSLDAEAYRGIQARHARGVVLAATDELARRLREAPGDIGVRDLVAAVRELHNVERALEGAPSQVVGLIRADGASAALAELLDQARAARPDGFGRAEKPAREAGRPLVEVQAEVVEVAVDPAAQGTATAVESITFQGVDPHDYRAARDVATISATQSGVCAASADGPTGATSSPSDPATVLVARPTNGGGGGGPREPGGSI